jgi:hypothetical protein
MIGDTVTSFPIYLPRAVLFTLKEKVLELYKNRRLPPGRKRKPEVFHCSE